jgi:hypothetical protein
MRLLLDYGANTNAQGGVYGSALQAASYLGNEKMVCLPLDYGVGINAQGGKYGSALQAYGNALQAASYNGNEEVM